MPEKSLEEILKDLRCRHQTCDICRESMKEICNVEVFESAQSIRDYYLAKLPKEGELCVHFSRRIGEITDCKYCMPKESKRKFLVQEFREHIAEMRKAIEEG